MGTRFSPFVIGDWVRGERFYGRREQLEEILGGHRKSIWLLGTRRSGKTSMLKELELLTQNEPGRGFFPIFWDFQGADNRQGLEESWTEALLDAEDRLEAKGISVDDFEGESLFSAIGQLRRQLRSMDLKLLALCDEAEELIRLQRSDPVLLRRLRRALQSAQGIHCVLASSIRLWSLSESNEDTSPFLNGFTPPIYLQRLSDEAARSLVRQEQMPARIRPNLDDEVVEGILQCCDNQAYLLQLLAKRTVEHGDLDEARDRVAADQMVRHFFETDVEMLSDSDRRVLSMLSDGSAATSPPHDGRFEERAMEGSIQDSLYRLENLHFIRPDEERRFVLSNYFFRRWIGSLRGSGASSDVLKPQSQVEQPPLSSELWLTPDQGEGELVAERYRLLERLSEGAQGVVYRAQDELLGVLIAIKVLKPEFATNPEALERFRHEILLSRDLGHSNILRTYDLGSWKGRIYLTMHWVDGPTLRRLIREQAPLAAERVVFIGTRLASALAAAHERNVLHRDLKPANILMERGGSPMIADFGLARMIDAPGVTQSDGFVGTPRYASPEQARQVELDERSDIYSLGVILYEMATGHVPFSAPSIVAVLVKHSREPAPDPRLSRPELPEQLAQIILRCLEKRSEDRYSRAIDLERALGEVELRQPG